MRRLVLLSLIAALMLSGCYLISDDGPATLQPRISPTDAPLRTLGYSTLAPQTGGTPAATPIARVSRAQLYTLLNQVTSASLLNSIQTLQNFHSRHVNSRQDSSTEGIGAARSWLYGEFLKIQDTSRGNFQAFEHPFDISYNGVDSRQHNIVGIINGTLQNTPAIVIGAHYDSRTDDLNDAKAFAPGADDNGSGVAAVLEMARVLSQIRPRSTLIFVLFAAEEVNRRGSIAFVRDYIQRSNIDVRLMINIDTVGSTNSQTGEINDREMRIFSEGPDQSASRDAARMIDFITDTYSSDLKLVFVEDQDRIGRFGDHFSFNEAGIPAVRIIEALEDTPNREGRDTIEHIEEEYIRKSVRTLTTMVTALSDGLPAPSNIVIRDRGDGALRILWQPVEGATGYIIALRSPGTNTFENLNEWPADGSFPECDCFARFSAVAVATLNEDGVMGPLSPAVPMLES